MTPCEVLEKEDERLTELNRRTRLGHKKENAENQKYSTTVYIIRMQLTQNRSQRG